MENLGFLFAAYTLIFVAIFLYVLFIWRRQAALETELRAMAARLKALSEAADTTRSAGSRPGTSG
jgi:CcmD family protein